MRTLMLYLAVGAAGFAGAVTRLGVTRLFGQTGWRFPLGTMVINVTGSLFLGWFLTYIAGRNVSDIARLAIGTGFVGAYTTFSTYMFDTVSLSREGANLAAMVNLFLSLALGLAAVRLGMYLGQR
jgi:CrcB protein